MLTMKEAADRLGGARVAYTDLDGTMLGRNGSFVHDADGAPTTEPVEALLAAESAGIEIIPTSGRALRGLTTDARILGLGTVIAEMGAVIAYNFGREVVENRGEAPGDDLPVAEMERTGALDALLSRYEGKLEHHMPWATWRQYTALLRGAVDIAEAEAYLAERGHGWLHLHDNGRLHGPHLGMPAGSVRVYHLQPRGVSKGLAVEADRARRSIPADACIALGDSIADLELAQHVGTFVLMRDALQDDPALAAAVEGMDNVIVTDRPQNLGWAEAIRAILG